MTDLPMPLKPCPFCEGPRKTEAPRLAVCEVCEIVFHVAEQNWIVTRIAPALEMRATRKKITGKQL